MEKDQSKTETGTVVSIKSIEGGKEKERDRITEIVNKRLEIHDESRKAAQEKLHGFCERLRAQIDKLEERINSELEEKFTAEDNRLQNALNELRTSEGSEISKTVQRAKAELLVMQLYDVIEHNTDEKPEIRPHSHDHTPDPSIAQNSEGSISVILPERKKMKLEETVEEPTTDLTSLYELKTERVLVPEMLELGKPTISLITKSAYGRVSIQFKYLNPAETSVFSKQELEYPIECKCLVCKKGDNEGQGNERLLENRHNGCFSLPPDTLVYGKTYRIRVKAVAGDKESEWSDEAEFTAPEFEECCIWKECPDDVDEDRKYSVDEKNSRIVTKIGYDGWCTIIGSTPLPPNKVTSWSIKILKSRRNNGYRILIGVAPSDINQNERWNFEKCGWYFDCCNSALCSGPPHDYDDKEYGPRKEIEQYVHTGDSVGIVMDTTKGELSFVLDGVSLGVAFKGIPLDKPLVPCVLLCYEGDSIELLIQDIQT